MFAVVGQNDCIDFVFDCFYSTQVNTTLNVHYETDEPRLPNMRRSQGVFSTNSQSLSKYSLKNNSQGGLVSSVLNCS